MSEFDLIRRYFTHPPGAGVLGVGDDCALLPGGPGAWAVSTDLLLENRHFFPDVAPHTLGHKALAVNLSDLAAMGATPRGFVLGLGLPEVRAQWLQEFSDGLLKLSRRYACPLVGGDTTRSEQGLTISVTVFGMLDARRALRRDAARPGDDIWVSGTLGEADVALRLLYLVRNQGGATPSAAQNEEASGAVPSGVLPSAAALDALLASTPMRQRAELLAQSRGRLEAPEPRVALGLALGGLAHAAIDISDGLLQDLGHIVAASGCKAVIEAARVPAAPCLDVLGRLFAWRAALAGGDAYELCFTAPPSARSRICAISSQLGLPVSRIGAMEEGEGVVVLAPDGGHLDCGPGGFDHFAGG